MPELMVLGLQLLALGLAFALPLAAVLWMAAQYFQTRQLSARLGTLEGEVRRLVGAAGRADGPSPGAEATNEGADGPAQ